MHYTYPNSRLSGFSSTGTAPDMQTDAFPAASMASVAYAPSYLRTDPPLTSESSIPQNCPNGVSPYRVCDVESRQSSFSPDTWYEQPGTQQNAIPSHNVSQYGAPSDEWYRNNPAEVMRPAVPVELRVSAPTMPSSSAHLFPNASPYSNPSSSFPAAGPLSAPYPVSQPHTAPPAAIPPGRLGPIGPAVMSSPGTVLDSYSDVNPDDEPPFLEELGIYPERIWQRMKSALLFYKLDHDLLVDVDMCGPLFIAACLGCCLLLSGKVHFGYIYGLSVTGCLSVCFLLNLMSQKEGISLYSTISILGYGLLPVVGLACLSIFLSLRSFTGAILSLLCVLWCTATASRFFETALEMMHQRFLVAYPISLLYGSFVLITVF